MDVATIVIPIPHDLINTIAGHVGVPGNKPLACRTPVQSDDAQQTTQPQCRTTWVVRFADHPNVAIDSFPCATIGSMPATDRAHRIASTILPTKCTVMEGHHPDPIPGILPHDNVSWLNPRRHGSAFVSPFVMSDLASGSCDFPVPVPHHIIARSNSIACSPAHLPDVSPTSVM